jgi:hypothetical protein
MEEDDNEELFEVESDNEEEGGIPQECELTLTQNGNTALNYLGYSFRKHHILRGNIILWN